MAGTVREEPGDDAEGGARIYEAGTAIAGRYRVVRFVGAGGMGEVYEVEDLVLGERVALKTLRADRETSERAVARLRRELALARKVTHRNVCRMYDVGVHEGRAFLTMELLDGETLADRARRGPLDLADLATIAQQLVAALAAAHAAGVVHRDFKSGNVMLVDGMRAVVTDFGLARSAQSEAEVSLTGDHAMIGTPAYMAPEQVEGREATPASDVYALGVVLFELATGTLPFRADTALATATARLRQRPPRPSKLRREVAAWDRTILACLALEPEARPSVHDVGPRTAGRGRAVVVAALAAAVAIVAILAWPRTPAPLPLRHWPTSLRPVDSKAAAHFDAADAARAADRRNEARQLLEQAVAASTEDPVAQAALAEVLDELGLEERARDAARRAVVARVPATDEARRFAALVDAEVRGDRAAAVTAARALVALAPDERAYRLRLAHALAAHGSREVRETLIEPRNVKEQIEHALLEAHVATAAGDHARAAARASRAVKLASERPHDRATALVQLAAAQWRTGDPTTAAATYERALATARDSGDGALVYRARKGLIDLDMAADRIRAGAERIAENAALASTLGDRALQADLLVTNTWFLTSIGRPDDADRGLEAALAITTDAIDRAWIDAGRAFVRLQRGELAEAARIAEATYLAGKKLGVAGLQGNAYHTWLTAVLELDDPVAITRARSTRTETVLRYIDAVAALREDRLDDAERAARPLVARETREGREAQVIVASVLLRRGKLDEASTLLDEVAPLLVGDGHSVLARRALVEAQAELRARRGDIVGAVEHLDQLRAACTAAGLELCAIRASARAALIDPARVPSAIANAESRGFRRVVRELQASRNAAASSP